MAFHDHRTVPSLEWGIVRGFSITVPLSKVVSGTRSTNLVRYRLRCGLFSTRDLMTILTVIDCSMGLILLYAL